MDVICINDITLFDHHGCNNIAILRGSKFEIDLKNEFDRSNELTQELHGIFYPYLIGKSSYLKYEFIINSARFYECFKVIE